MKFELKFKVYGNLKIINDCIEVKHNHFLIKLFKENCQFYISISKTIDEDSECLPTLNFNNEIKEVVLPKEEAYSEMLEYINHIESFAATDNKIEYIDKVNLEFKWIPENEQDNFSPVSSIRKTLDTEQELDFISQDWLMQTVLHKRQLGELFIPFSFFRDAKKMFYSAKYQTAFCTFYLMLEYFFYDKKRGYGINNNAFKQDLCLNRTLNKTLDQIKLYPDHLKWLNEQLELKRKKYDEEGLLTILNAYRNDFSHASNASKNRNIFNENNFFSLAYVTFILCNFVVIKKRLAPFVNSSELSKFYNR
ncbi:hypothetical protein [Chryseobacterium cheonjiense]|uniref:ApeA N-terminal domain-containing protein n=1 Tax=Chryseobacterium cheonjiense TaxID=2728845 RepID=A0A7Y0A5E8_9FLAO|nr:hypothetical protein [Chryseobacterium cheonjiense]NML57014.1 hypothetical protein [Chryseobacterium cheonjiense]